ncbi:glycoside hydrolase family 36 protein [Oceanispirochaeta sp.]|uniref:glycoside hydrolase family 36 protein n=1 Tax=Oceanispirochaeta sp. TaxID=2035350 RepID=UPI0026244D84|nr:glycoside hydrolase family 36 protein [Oceanispirochaeta sp.]MDA3958204.1 alpha-galactosidase [Oceanispirochaeta sp.]
MRTIDIAENGIYMNFEISENKRIRLLHFAATPLSTPDLTEYENSGFRLLELALSGYDRPEERHGLKYTVTSPGYRLEYSGYKDYRTDAGRKIEIFSEDEESGIYVSSHYQFYDGISVIRCSSTVENKGSESQCLEYISSFNLNGIEKEGLLKADEKMRLMIPHNSWQREFQWKSYSLDDLGMAQCQPDLKQRSSKAVHISNTGNWSTKEFLPMGYLENTETGGSLFWQIEHNGSWHWEISDQTGHLYLQLSGPSENESHWFKNLHSGEKFVSVPAVVGVSCKGFDESMGELTNYRRAIRRRNPDNEKLGIIFNDYMNCLWADPTTEKEMPLIAAAADLGCEYYCIDAGWYDEGDWWDSVGEWQPSDERFPGGIKEVIDFIRSKGMIPGLWLELEVMGIHCKKAKEVSADWFFHRHGKKVYDRSRFQLDFRNPEVREYASSVIRRLVEEYGVGYIKMDYNIEPGIGTEINADSVGDGLLEHERAYLGWLDSLFVKYPELIIENCSSGGLRIDYALLSRLSIQSTSDQEDFLRYATIAANSPTGVTPEQAAVWSYPLVPGDDEEVIFNMVNALLLRVHQSGNILNLDQKGKDLVKEALDYYKNIRPAIKEALPFWPLGLSSFHDTWTCLGLKTGDVSYVAVWKRDAGEDRCLLPLEHLKGKEQIVRCVYPADGDCRFSWNSGMGTLSVELPGIYSARLFEIRSKS